MASEGTKEIPDESQETMESLIPTFNMVQDLLEKTNGDQDPECKIQLPRIVVVGSQSAGKSSVLESLVGHSFLPRGTGIVTRCPIVLRLINTPGTEEWCTFDHIKDRKFEISLVEKEILRRTNEIAGTNLGITNDPITITFYSPNVLNLTVVDLPGLVQIPVGDQPENISTQIKDLLLSYISQENSVILAVSPGNIDIATSESINFAKIVDPMQERTIVVLTKLDLADDRNRMTEILIGKIVPVKLGIVGVINRSQVDIDNDKSISDVIISEKAFLQKNYSSVAHQNGTGFLAKKLNRILQKHIAASCKGLISTVRELATSSAEELTRLGDDGELSEEEKRLEMITVIDNFAKRYKAKVDGQQRSEITQKELTQGTRIDFILQSRLKAELDSLSVFKEMTDTDVLVAVRNAMPIGAKMIIPEVPLNHFVKEEIKKVTPLSDHIATLCFHEMVEMIDKCLVENSRFPKLNMAIYAVVNDLLNEKMNITKEILKTYFEVQSSSAMTAYPHYEEVFKKLMSPISVVDLGVLPYTMVNHQSDLFTLSNSERFTPEGPTSLTEQQLHLSKEMRTLAEKLFIIVRWQVQDFIAKAILSALIYKTVDNVGNVLNLQLNTPEKIDSLVREAEDVQSRRIFLKRKIAEYNEALKLLEGLRNEAA